MDQGQRPPQRPRHGLAAIAQQTADRVVPGDVIPDNIVFPEPDPGDLQGQVQPLLDQGLLALQRLMPPQDIAGDLQPQLFQQTMLGQHADNAVALIEDCQMPQPGGKHQSRRLGHPGIMTYGPYRPLHDVDQAAPQQLTALGKQPGHVPFGENTQRLPVPRYQHVGCPCLDHALQGLVDGGLWGQQRHGGIHDPHQGIETIEQLLAQTQTKIGFADQTDEPVLSVDNHQMTDTILAHEHGSSDKIQIGGRGKHRMMHHLSHRSLAIGLGVHQTHQVVFGQNPQGFMAGIGHQNGGDTFQRHLAGGFAQGAVRRHLQQLAVHEVRKFQTGQCAHVNRRRLFRTAPADTRSLFRSGFRRAGKQDRPRTQRAAAPGTPAQRPLSHQTSGLWRNTDRPPGASTASAPSSPRPGVSPCKA